MNLATRYLLEHNETVTDYDGVCGELADAIMQEGDHSLYVEGDGPWILGWVYHMVLLRDGLVHDAWCEGEALTPRDWLIKMFGAKTFVEVSLDGDTIFDGKCKDFPEEYKPKEENNDGTIL